MAAAELEPGDSVVEIGPGLGVLTRRLLAAGASVLAVELDPRLAEYLRRELYGVDRFELIEADALSLHPREFFPGEPIKVVANIPYHITSPLLHAFLEGERPPELTVLLVQLEVAERVAAAAGPDELPVGLRAERGRRRGRGARAGRPPSSRRPMSTRPSCACAGATGPSVAVGAATRAVLSGGAGGVPAAAQAGPQRRWRGSCP